MKKKLIQVYEVDPEEFKKEILVGIEKLLDDFSKQLEPKESEVWISRVEASKLMQISLVTIHNWSKDGILRAYRIGNRVRFRHSEIEQTLLNSNKRASG
jgi:excisionase family DNA binding protein